MARKAAQRAVTMTDVARLAGLSQTTVSFVLNDVPNISIPEETRERVWTAVKQLGYRPNAAAKLLRTNQSHTIGFITDEIATSAHAGNIIKGAQDLAWANGKILLVINTGADAAMDAAALELLLERQAEGIIYAAMYHREVRLPTTIRELPAVLLDCFVADRSLPSVVPDEIGGGRVATEVLIAGGHQRIGLINLPLAIPAGSGRFAGYQQALQAAGLPFDARLVRHMPDGDAPSGYEATLDLMRSTRPSALFCATDRMAMGAYDALRELGLRIPDDVAVVGFDNQELISAFLRPALTTVALPHYEMGQWAVQYLLDQQRHEAVATPLQHHLSCTLVPRRSV
jgi:LacI family transcriptional regulator